MSEEWSPMGKDYKPSPEKPTVKKAAKEPPSDNLVAREQLKSVVERIERLEEEKKAIADDIRDVYGEAKANGFDTKVLRDVIKLRKLDPAEREEHNAVRDLYMQSLGMLPEFGPVGGGE